MTEQKRQALIKLANRVVRLARFNKMDMPKEVVAKEKRLISSLFDSGVLNAQSDGDDIRKSILQHIAMMIANNHFERTGALGNTCLQCGRFGNGCERVFPEEELEQIDWIDVAAKCGGFIKLIEPSKAGEYEALLVDLHGAYGIDKDRDLPIVRTSAEKMKVQRNSNWQ